MNHSGYRRNYLQEGRSPGLPVGQEIILRRFDRLADSLEGALQDAADELTQQGLSGVSEIKERIPERGADTVICEERKGQVLCRFCISWLYHEQRPILIQVP